MSPPAQRHRAKTLSAVIYGNTATGHDFSRYRTTTVRLDPVLPVPKMLHSGRPDLRSNQIDTPGYHNHQTCLYQVLYNDNSFTVGDFSTEMLTFRRTRVPNIALGCSHNNEGLFVTAAVGLLGLGRGK
ncbi:Aspartyl protease family protein 2 [Camellia lanceoleosa]|uniref:Aspartyl protease family protein 2 n=1 Tax=Camellia lanceoleosa TaxID=1840588 RepID=A0ACC0IA49_9ERIC|nr:Aspartyl protease family protein 2 [Camellia lanceoleosa]